MRRGRMKRTLIAVLTATFLTATLSFAEEGQMHEMMHKQGGPKADERTELNIPAPMKVMQKGMMRQHMDTLGEITAALAANDLGKAADVAKSKLGWSQEEEKRCSMVEKMTGEADFTVLGKAVHKKADQLADEAKAGNRDNALKLLAELIDNCNACHKKFRH